MPEDDAVVRIRDVVKEFGPLRVLDGVGFEVKRGQTVAVIGRSGSGKSTLLRCVAGLETVQGGEIEVCGNAVGRPGSVARAQLRRDVEEIVGALYRGLPAVSARRLPAIFRAQHAFAFVRIALKALAEDGGARHPVEAGVGVGDVAALEALQRDQLQPSAAERELVIGAGLGIPFILGRAEQLVIDRAGARRDDPGKAARVEAELAG